MTGPSWLVDSKRIAKKIKSASERGDPKTIKWISNPTKACPKCSYIINNDDVVQEWPGLPSGVKFDPSDQEMLLHLMAKLGKAGVQPHPFINEFILTVEDDNGICYTHPQKLPGVKNDGTVAHFFHRTFKAYNTGTRKRRKIRTDEHADVRWHKTGKTKPVLLDGEHVGCKKIMVLYVSAPKGGKAEKTNWVMHQYHLGTGEDEVDGEYVVSKIFHQQQLKPCERNREDPNIVAAETVGAETIIVACSGSATPDNEPENQHLMHSPEEIYDQVKLEHELINNSNACEDVSEKFLDGSVVTGNGNENLDDQDAIAHDNHQTEDSKWWEGESQFLLDSQQLAEGIAICDEFLQSQSSCAGEEEHHSKPSLSDYARMGVEDLKRDLEECQILRNSDNKSNGDLDTPSDMRLSQLEFGSQDSFMAWAGSKLAD
ncbi:NAC domain-containing protein 8 [Apostasia shenzhenica]|uniref:NAC domain-containing protein 8 n=1 Tax=Apostasia shenzhenica TaxID=1088818 RepID=A0A2I0AG40_9ASPA|nr:NAC domain-containing protein 8 [Apostasia shenzhenica]